MTRRAIIACVAIISLVAIVSIWRARQSMSVRRNETSVLRPSPASRSGLESAAPVSFDELAKKFVRDSHGAVDAQTAAASARFLRDATAAYTNNTPDAFVQLLRSQGLEPHESYTGAS